MTRIIPIKDLKDTTRISELCHQTNGPIHITKNGYQDMVIMSTEVFDLLSANWELYKDIGISLKQMENGEVKDARQSLGSFRGKYGIQA